MECNKPLLKYKNEKSQEFEVEKDLAELGRARKTSWWRRKQAWSRETRQVGNITLKDTKAKKHGNMFGK